MPLAHESIGNQGSSTRGFFSRRLFVKEGLKNIAPWLAFFLSLLTTLWAWHQVRLDVARNAAIRFDLAVDRAVSSIDRRMLEYDQALRGGIGFFAGADSVNREQWKAYVDTLQIENYYPGILGMGVAPKITKDELAENAKRVQADGFPNFHVWPEGNRNIYFPVIFIEPYSANAKALGYDLFYNPTHRAAMEKAVNSGTAVISAKVSLIQEEAESKESGFILYMPFFQKGIVFTQPSQKRDAIIGFVFGVFRMKDFMTGVMAFNPEIDLEIYDGHDISPSSLMYDSGEDIGAPRFVRTLHINISGHAWTLLMKTRPPFEEAVDNQKPLIVLLAGDIMSFLIFVVVWSLASTRVKALELAESMTQAMKKSEERFALAAYGAKDGIWDWDVKMNELYVSPRWELPPGKADDVPDDIKKWRKLASIEEWYALIHPDDSERVKREIERHLSGKTHHFQSEFRVNSKGGVYRWMLGRGVAVRDESGKPYRMAGSTTDITERKLAEEEIRTAKEQAEDATKLKDKFVSLVAHDLRSPFASIIGLLRLLEANENQTFTDKQKDIIKRVISTGINLLEMIDKLLNISRFQTGNIALEQQFFNTKLAVGVVLDTLTPLAHDKGIIIVNDVNDDARLYADKNLFMEVIRNLVSNSIKFCKKGDRITIFTPERMDTSIIVRDTGCGITPEILPNIFRHEVKTSMIGTAGEKGTGLGLPYSHDIINAHGGKLSVESTKGVGSIFYVTLPKIRPVILLVEDDPEARAYYKHMLKGLDAEIIETATEEEAESIILNKPPHVAIVDISLPGNDGFKLLEWIRKGPHAKAVRVVVATADTNIETREKAFRLGADDFVTKPIDPNELIPRVTRTLSAMPNSARV